MIKCKLELCIFNENGKCVVKEIDIDALGNCKSSLLVKIPTEEMSKYKENILKD